jgi:hypothetical protein
MGIPHPAIIPKTKPQAEKLAAELKAKLSAEEIVSAKIISKDNTVEGDVKEILAGSK